MMRQNRAEKSIPFFNQKEYFDRICDYDENLFNNPFCREKFDQRIEKNGFQSNINFVKKLENERYYEND